MQFFVQAPPPNPQRLFQTLAALAFEAPARRDAKLAELEHEIDRLARVDGALAASVRGFLAAMRWDAHAVDRHFAHALELARPEAAATILFNHAVSLERMHRLEAAAVQAAAAVERDPEVIDHVRDALWLALRAGRLGLARAMLTRLEHASDPAADADQAARILGRLARAGGQDAVKAAFAAVHEVLARAHVVTRRADLWLGPDEEVGYTHKAWVSTTSAAELNAAIAAVMVDRAAVPEPAMHVLTAYVVGLLPDESRAEPDEGPPAAAHAG